MLSVVVATMNADVYGQFDADSIHAASDRVVLDFSDVGRLFFMQAPMTHDGNLPAASWQQLCAREGQLQPGQGLLPPLQQQLLDTLGCNSKGFLWLAPVWKARHTQCLYFRAVRVCGLINGCLCSSGAAPGATDGSSLITVTDTMLRLFLLPPALVLRQQLHEQRVSTLGVATGQDPPEVLYMLTACIMCLQMLVFWRVLRRRVPNAGAGASEVGVEWVAAGDGVLPSDGLVTPMLHEVLQLLMHLLLGVIQAAQPGSSSGGGSRQGSTSAGSSNSSSTGASARGSNSASTSASRPQQGGGAPQVSPAAAASVLSGLIARLLPAATQVVMGEASGTPKSTTTTSSSSSSAHVAASSGSSRSRSSSSNSSLAATWVPLLLRLTGALEQAMRFEAQWGPSQPDLNASQVLHHWGGMAGKFPQGLAWGATYMLLSQQRHAVQDHFSYWLETKAGQLLIDRLQDVVCTRHSHQPALLQWMLDNTPLQQLPVAQQRVLSLLCTAAKVCLSAEGGRQHVQSNALYDGIVHTAWGVLGRLLPQQTVIDGSRTATAQADDGSSNSSGSSQNSRAPEHQAAAAVGQQNPAGGTVSHADAALSWLSLLGRCFLQASQQMASTIKQCAPDSAASSNSQQQAPRQQQQQQDDAGRSSLLMLISICDLGTHILPHCIARVAVLLAAAMSRPILQLPQQQAGEVATAACRLASFDEAAGIPDQEQQQLQGAGQQLAECCSSLGLDLTAAQQSTWALAETAAAAAPALLGIRTCISAAETEHKRDKLYPGLLLYPLQECGLTGEHAIAVDMSITHMQGARRVSEATAAALLHSSAVQTYMQQLTAAGVALSTLPTATACNSPCCTSLMGASEQQSVSGKASRCSACLLAFYCQRSCQKQHWDAHKPVCKAVQAALAAAATAVVAAATGSSV
jgi:hypothetical protein